MAVAKGKKIGKHVRADNEPCLIPNPELTIGVVPYVNLGFFEKDPIRPLLASK